MPTTTPAPGAPPRRPAAPSSEVVVRARAVTRVFGTGDAAVQALAGVDLELRTGSFTAVMGPSGSGKSTLMHCLAGLDRPTSGSITVGGVDLTTLGEAELTRIRRDRFGFVFQAFNLLPALTARQNILLPLELAGRAVDGALLDRLVRTLGIADRLQHRPSELSGGQQQRVAVARALIGGPQVVFADEPTGALDTRTGHELLAHLRAGAREQGRTVVMVTHDPVAAGYADRAVLLQDGRVAGELGHPDADAVLAALRSMAG